MTDPVSRGLVAALWSAHAMPRPGTAIPFSTARDKIGSPGNAGSGCIVSDFGENQNQRTRKHGNKESRTTVLLRLVYDGTNPSDDHHHADAVPMIA